MIQVQLALVYWQTFCCKMAGAQWLDGTAVYYATRLDDMIRFPAPFISDNMFVLKTLDYFTLVIEFAAWTAIWVKEIRYYVLVGLLCLHLGIDYLINLPVFEWAFIVTLVTFIEPTDLEYVFQWLRAKIGARPDLNRSGQNGPGEQAENAGAKSISIETVEGVEVVANKAD
jgi:hypothetical protein